ncbi:MAG TPA: DUF502 domain-containing protein [Phycisphaerae bacterium]|nr:DUF502 domain-containing protein [Phycisphaerae bacterium]
MSGKEDRTDQRNELPRSQDPRRPWPMIRTLLRTRIVAGLLTLIPIWVTWVVVKFVFDNLRSAMDPLAGRVAKALLEHNKALLPQTVNDYQEWVVPAVTVLLTLFLLYLLGLFSANVFGARFLLWLDGIFGKVPLVKTIYRSTKQIVLTVGGGQSSYFQRVVLVEYPRPGMKCIGFLTSVVDDADTGRKIAAIFIASTPTCSTGYTQLVPLEEVSETDWTVEEAVKAVMSGGLVLPENVRFDRVHPVKMIVPQARAAEMGGVPLQPASQVQRGA